MIEYRFGEFFSGPGGMSCGAISAVKGSGFRMVPTWAVDHDRSACETYHHNIHKGQGVIASETDKGNVPGIDVAQGTSPLVLNADVRNVDVGKLNPVEAFLFGFPCNDFSDIGESKGLKGEFGSLYRHAIRLIKDKNPISSSLRTSPVSCTLTTTAPSVRSSRNSV